MRINVTHGVQRVLMLAESYRPVSSSREPFPQGRATITSLGVLLALEEESECRAAIWLAELGISREIIANALPFERQATTPVGLPPADAKLEQLALGQRLRFFLDGEMIFTGRLEPVLADAMFSMMQRLQSLIPHPVVATEHLLLALASEEGSVGRFLHEHGVSADALWERIAEQEGVDLNPDTSVITNWDDEPSAAKKSSLANEADVSPANNSCPLIYSSQLEIPEAGYASPATQGGCARPKATAHTGCGMQAVFRIIDASANRAFEAARVIEDYLRFGLNDRHLTNLVKQLRHELASVLQELPAGETINARDTLSDVGTSLEGKNEYHRSSLDDLLKANFSRLQESLRSIEEYGKIAMPASTRAAEQLRYLSYTLQKAVWSTFVGTSQLADARLYVLVDARPTQEAFAALVQAILQGGADVIQLRAKNTEDRTLLERARLLRHLTNGTRTLMIVNDRPDIAVFSGADGVHVGQEELPVADVRKLVGGKMLIGVSTHDLEQARKAVLDGANYLGAGPTFPSTTKSFESFPGVAFLEQLAAEITLPVFAIGGIDARNLHQVLRSGIKRVAVQSAVTGAGNPSEACRELKKRLTDL
ncbi:MAG: thiamine phosphate synthase [Planctomycetaceae bacterium]|nr:thiamine phosphate synthase [Planctomycetaceae bacterium]